MTISVNFNFIVKEPVVREQDGLEWIRDVNPNTTKAYLDQLCGMAEVRHAGSKTSVLDWWLKEVWGKDDG